MAINPTTANSGLIDGQANTQGSPVTNTIETAPIKSGSVSDQLDQILAPTQTPRATPSTATATPWNVTSDQTAQGQISGIIDSKALSPLMERAQAINKDESNARGLVNTSMGVQGGTAAVLDKAVSISNLDAATSASAGKFNAETGGNTSQFNTTAENVFARDAQGQKDVVANKRTDAGYATETADRLAQSQAAAAAQTQRNTEANKGADAGYAAETAATLAQTQAAAAEREQTSKQNMQLLDNENKLQMVEIDNQYRLLTTKNQGAKDLYDTYQKAINGLLLNNTLDTANKRVAINTQLAALNDGLKMYSDVANLKIGKVTGSTQGDNLSGTTDPAQVAWDSARANLGDRPPNLRRGTSGTHPRQIAWDAALEKLGARPAA